MTNCGIVHIIIVYKGQVNPFPNNKNLDSSKVKDFADDNFKFDENRKMFFIRLL